METEWLDVYDKNRKPTGRRVKRTDPRGTDEYFIVVHVCILNDNNEMLIQKRQDTKKSYPGCWDVSAGGFSNSGEMPTEAALRECMEELGLQFNSENIQYIVSAPHKHIFDDFYFARCNVRLGELSLQEEEVSDVKWASLDEILRMIDTGEFVDYSKDLIKDCFAAANLNRENP